MASTIPNIVSYAKIPSGGKRRRFVATGSSVVRGVLTGTRQNRVATNGNPMKSVFGPIGANTSLRDAQAAVHETYQPGTRLTV